MRGNSFLVCAASALVVLASPAFAQNDDELEVTLQVLDDVADIEGVVISVGDADSAADAEGEGRDEAEVASDAPAAPARADDDEADEDFEAERDEESEGRVEDRDVAEPPLEVEPETPAEEA